MRALIGKNVWLVMVSHLEEMLLMDGLLDASTRARSMDASPLQISNAFNLTQEARFGHFVRIAMLVHNL